MRGRDARRAVRVDGGGKSGLDSSIIQGLYGGADDKDELSEAVERASEHIGVGIPVGVG